MNTSPEFIARICVDILIVALLFVSAVAGWKKGLAAVVFSCFRWLICIVVSLFGALPFKAFLMEKTLLDEKITANVKSVLTSNVTGSSFISILPKQVHDSPGIQDIAGKAVSSISDLLMSVISFLILFIGIIIITKLIAIALESRNKETPIGFINGLLGFCFGLLRGVFIVGVLMLAVLPALGFIDPRAASPIISGIRQSMLAGLFYDHNPITMIFDMF